MDLEVLKFFGQFGLAGVMLAVLGTVTWRIGLRMIASIDQLCKSWKEAVEKLGQSWKESADRVETKLDLHTKADVAAWADVIVKIQGHFQDSSDELASMRQHLSEELSILRRDLAVLGTRLDVAIDRVPHVVDEEDYSKRLKIPRVERHESPLQSGTPVVDRPVRRPGRGNRDE